MATSFYTTHSGAFFVSPGGQSEQGSSVAAAGFRWGTLNIADGHHYADWSKSITQFQAAGMRTPLWGRVANSSISAILGEAIAYHLPCILDIETEFKTTPPKVYEQQIRAVKAANPTYTREIVLSTGGWLYNDADYAPIAHRPVLLQVFLTDMHLAVADLPRVTKDCVTHARLKGFRDIGVTFQCDRGAQPSWYSYWAGKPRSYFPGDAIGSQQAWNQWAVSA